MTEMEALIDECVGKRVWAVVGASTNPEKYGYQILHTLHDAGYRVYGVNPKGGEVDGIPLYPSLADLPEKPEVVDIVVPPQVTEQIVRQCADLGIERVWMQPGAESEEAIRFCEEHGIRVVYGTCAMIHRRTWED